MLENTSKENATKKFLEYLGILKEEALAICDGKNDISMFENVKYKIAMKNAIPEIEARADYITESNSNDRVGKVLRKIIRLQEEKMKIGIDMDNTICSTSEKILEYQEEFIKQEKISSNTLWKNDWYKTKFLNIYL